MSSWSPPLNISCVVRLTRSNSVVNTWAKRAPRSGATFSQRAPTSARYSRSRSDRVTSTWTLTAATVSANSSAARAVTTVTYTSSASPSECGRCAATRPINPDVGMGAPVVTPARASSGTSRSRPMPSVRATSTISTIDVTVARGAARKSIAANRRVESPRLTSGIRIDRHEWGELSGFGTAHGDAVRCLEPGVCAERLGRTEFHADRHPRASSMAGRDDHTGCRLRQALRAGHEQRGAAHRSTELRIVVRRPLGRRGSEAAHEPRRETLHALEAHHRQGEPNGGQHHERLAKREPVAARPTAPTKELHGLHPTPGGSIVVP